jgi:hypothetical protein
MKGKSTIRELIKETVNDIRRMDTSFDHLGDAVTSLSRVKTKPLDMKRMIKHYMESHTDEFFESLEELVQQSIEENQAMMLVAKKMNEKYGEF